MQPKNEIEFLSVEAICLIIQGNIGKRRLLEVNNNNTFYNLSVQNLFPATGATLTRNASLDR